MDIKPIELDTAERNTPPVDNHPAGAGRGVDFLSESV